MNAADMNRIKITSLARRLTQTATGRIPSLWLCQAMVALLLLTACVRDDFDDLPKPPAGAAVSFRTETLDEFATRATGSTTRSAGYTTTGTYAIGSMGIYAGYTSAAWNGSASPKNFFDNLPVSRTSDTSSWTYGDEKLWPGSGYLTFFAYAPHSDNAVYGTNKPTITATTGTPTLAYTIAATHDKQVDLLVSTPVKDQTKRDYVTIPLRHALSKIAFSARVANTPGADVQIRVTGITLSGLYGSGTILMDGQNRTWTTSGTNNHSYTLTNTPGEGLKNLPLTDIYQPLTPTDGHLFLLPQTLVEGDKGTGAAVTITYETQVGTNLPDVKSFDLELSRAITAFNPGIAYNLMFTIDNGVTFIVAPTPWDNTDVEVDIKNRILNVSRIEASVYPGVPTRIYFWSNQPKDSVYVRTNGNIDIGKYPTGASYIVNDAFQNLSGKAAANLHYSGFDGVSTASGEGYIDVWHVTGTTTPFAPVLADGDKRHIWINASGLTRNVLLNSVIRGNPTTTPYVGTFHRWNETGERIVTWGFNGDWTATVIEGAGDILIDNLPSPFMATGQLYSESNDDTTDKVGDPEAAQLASTATTAVTGKGRVYFRVGWKSRLGSATTAPRYGRIQLIEYQADGITVARTNILYIRQGEQPDYVMDPDDGGTNNRPNAVKWSPYNLTANGIDNTKQWVQIAVNRSNAMFTTYPTQAGTFFQWANATNQRYAYNPTTPTGAPTSWNNVIPNGFWNALMTTHETCPPGYRRPTSGSISGNIVDYVTNSELHQSFYADYSLTDNTVLGYYADGFFDRRNIMKSVGFGGNSNSAVLPSSVQVGYLGRLIYRTTTPASLPTRSLFFPMPGYRLNTGSLQYSGSWGNYWLASLDNNDPTFLELSNTGAYPDASNFNTGYSIRCVRDIGFVTELNPDTEVLVPTALSFDAASADIKAATVEKYTNYIIAAISAMPTKAYNIRARVTFTGTVTSIGVTANIDGLLDHAYVASGSTVTYDFSHPSLTWAAGKHIQIGVTTANWEYQINGSSTWTTGGFGIAATLNAKGKIVVRKK